MSGAVNPAHLLNNPYYTAIRAVVHIYRTRGNDMESEDTWKYVAKTRRYYRKGTNEKFLIVGDSGHEPLTYWFSVYKRGAEIDSGEGYASVEEAQKAATGDFKD